MLCFSSNIYLEKALMQLSLSVGIKKKKDEFHMDNNTVDVFNICFYEKRCEWLNHLEMDD